jgi:hypothetical protein
MFNEEVEFYYPQRDVLIASDGKWFVEKSIKVSDIAVDGVPNNNTLVVNNFLGTRIQGNVSGATAIIENAESYYEGGSLIKELKISSQVGEFESGEVIQSTFVENGVTKTISANLFSGIINTVDILKSGSGYYVGNTVTVESNTGSGAVIVVSAVSSGNLTSIVPFEGGAGFRVGNPILVTGGSGTGANAAVGSVTANSYFHPNSYNVVWSTISLESGTRIGNSRYSNLNSSISNPANSWIQNSMSVFVYSNTGPISTVTLYSSGQNYSSNPTITSQANTRIRNLGILGKMRIVDGGQGYRVGDVLQFTNIRGGYGTGANGIVRAVNTAAQNAISDVGFVNVPGHITGGSGYNQLFLPKINVISSNAQAFGANVIVTAVLGSGESLLSVGSSAGAIEKLQIISRGTNYLDVPTLNLKSIGDGTAQAVATIITGAYTYPGRYVNDDGHLSSYNFLQNRDYYQKFSYVVRLKQSIEKYREAMKYLIHPAGMKLFGEYIFVDEDQTIKVPIRNVTDEYSTILFKPYEHDTANANLVITYIDHNLSVNDSVYLEWASGNVKGNTVEGPYKVRIVRDENAFIIYNNNYLANTSLPATTGNVYVGKII